MTMDGHGSPSDIFENEDLPATVGLPVVILRRISLRRPEGTLGP